MRDARAEWSSTLWSELDMGVLERGMAEFQGRLKRMPASQRGLRPFRKVCSADGLTHTESNNLYGKVKHRYRPNLSPRQRPAAKARPDQAALAASA